tara:strand:- start:4570 stop:7359 length:2790 start_codon:yes stop_codon:yes gene_type:complete
MALKIADRVKETSLTQGSGSLTLEGAFGGFQTFSATVGDGNTTYYVIENESRWEVGIGTYTSSSNTLSRDTVLKSSQDGDKINIYGVATVFCSYPADRAVIRQEDGLFTESGLLTLTGGLNLSPDFTITRNSAGNFFHAYKDDAYDRTIGLYTDGNTSPEWRLGLKNSPSDNTDPPSFGYVYGKDGQVGLVGNSSNSITLGNSSEFAVKHNNLQVLRASSLTGIHLNANSSAYPAVTINGAAAQSQPLTEWADSAGNVLSIVDQDGKVGINKTSATYELDVDGSGRLESVFLTSGIYFQDGTFQATAHSDVLTNQVSGWANTTIVNGDNAVSGYFETRTNKNAVDILTVSGLLYDDTSLSGYVDSRNAAISGWAGSKITNEISSLIDSAPSTLDTLKEIANAINDDDNIATTLTSLITNTSGNLQSQITSNANNILAVSGWADSAMDTRDAAVSGWAAATFITSDNDTTYTAGSGLELHGTEFQAAISGANLLATNAPTDSYVPSYDAATGRLTWVANTGGGGTTYTAGSGLVLDGDNKFHSTFASGNYLLGEIRDNSSSGVVISGIASEAYGWGDHSSAGYLTSETSHSDVLVDGDFGSQGIMKRGASAGNYSIITDNSSNWDTAYGWGDHSTQGYLTSDSDTTYTGDSGVLLQGTVFNANLVDYTVQSTAANSRTTTASRTYAVQVDSSDKLVINIPWTDTTYSIGDGGLTTNDFTTADHNKLDGIESGATADQTQADINGLAITTVGTITNGTWEGTAIGSSYIADAFLKNDADDTTTGTVTMANLIIGDAGNIGSASDNDAVAIASDGEVTLSQRTTFSKAQKTPIKSNTDGVTVTFDLDEANTHTVTLGGNRTLALSNASVGQKFIIRLSQDATGSRTVNWFSTINWPGDLEPVLTTSVDKTDVFGFICTATDTYDGFVIGYNL